MNLRKRGALMPSLASHDCQPWPAPKHICRRLATVA